LSSNNKPTNKRGIVESLHLSGMNSMLVSDQDDEDDNDICTSSTTSTTVADVIWSTFPANKRPWMSSKLHLHTSELPGSYNDVDCDLPSQVVRARTYNDIAHSLPPALVTKVQYRYPHSLTPDAFECIENKYTHLKVVQALTQVTAWDFTGAFTDALGTNLKPRRYPVTAICALLILYNTSGGEDLCNNTLSIIELFRMEDALEEACVGGSWLSGDAYLWLEDNWPRIKKMPSQPRQMPKYPPGRRDTSAWRLCLRSVLRGQTGLNWPRTRESCVLQLFEVSQVSIWRKLGVKVDKYVDWYRSPRSSEFGIINQEEKVQCTTCVGEPVVCVRQKNSWVCNDLHRSPFEPLDVSSTRMVVVVAEEEKDPEEEKDEEETKEEDEEGVAIGRLLGYLGITSGLVVNGCGITCQDMKISWKCALVLPGERTELLMLYGVDIKDALTHRSNTKKILTCVAVILQSMGLQLQQKRQRIDGIRSRKYYVVPI
jgi:hypothetical protein